MNGALDFDHVRGVASGWSVYYDPALKRWRWVAWVNGHRERGSELVQAVAELAAKTALHRLRRESR